MSHVGVGCDAATHAIYWSRSSAIANTTNALRPFMSRTSTTRFAITSRRCRMSNARRAQPNRLRANRNKLNPTLLTGARPFLGLANRQADEQTAGIFEVAALGCVSCRVDPLEQGCESVASDVSDRATIGDDNHFQAALR